MNIRQQFLKALAPTSFEPMALHICRAEGAQLYDAEGKSYTDLIGGISVCNVGHTNPEVVHAIHRQVSQYMHVMVFGEVVQSPQVLYASLLTEQLDTSLNSVYFTNSGAEAVEGAMKLVKRVTGRTQFIACHHSYHGSTQGALSLLGDEYFRNAYRPLLPDIHHIDYNSFEDIEAISERTAAIILEPVQAEAGVIVPDINWLKAVRRKCDETGTLLVFDEIQTGFGRTGSLFAHQEIGVVPDILLLGKALGGGMPLGAFIASKDKMDHLAVNPVLGHITTFGGHPVSCAAGLAAFEYLRSSVPLKEINRKGALFATLLQHPRVLRIRQKGLMLSVQLESFEKVKEVISKCLNSPEAVFTDWFLFAPDCLRIVPPLTISDAEIRSACATILANL